MHISQQIGTCRTCGLPVYDWERLHGCVNCNPRKSGNCPGRYARGLMVHVAGVREYPTTAHERGKADRTEMYCVGGFDFWNLYKQTCEADE